jgi:hypothetical protein
MILLCSSLLKGEEAKITMTVGEVSAEGLHSAIGKIDIVQTAGRLGCKCHFPLFYEYLKKIYKSKGPNATLKERISDF